MTANPAIRRGLSASSLAWAFTALHGANWHPLTWVSHLLDVSLFGMKAGGHHATSLALHVAATLVLFVVLDGMTGARWRSLFTAALFGIHPLHVESVAWVAERKDVLSAFIGFAAVGAYGSFTRRPGASRFALTALLLGLGLLAKPMLVTLPLLFLVLDWWPLGRFGALPARRLLLEKLPLLLLSATSGFVTILAQARGGALASGEIFPLGVRLQNALVSCAAYLGNTIFPTGLTIYYRHPGASIPAWKSLAALALLSSLSAATLLPRLRRGSPYLPAGWVWYLVSLLPVIGLIQVGAQARADRYTYIPLVGLFIALAWGADELTRGLRHRTAILASGATAALSLLAVVAAGQIAQWRDSRTLFSHALAVDPGSYWAHNNIGNLQSRQGLHAEAEKRYRRALELRPDYTQARYNLGLSLAAQGRLADAVAQYREVLRTEPRNSEARNNLGSTLALLGDAGAAEHEFRRAIELAPREVKARLNLATLLIERGDRAAAESLCREAARLDPFSAEARYNLGSLLAGAGDFEGAERQFRDAVRLDPDFAEAHNNLGAALVALGRPQEAAAHFRDAVRLRPGYRPALVNLERYQARFGEGGTSARP